MSRTRFIALCIRDGVILLIALASVSALVVLGPVALGWAQ